MKIQTEGRGRKSMYKEYDFVNKHLNKHGRLKENKMSGKEIKKARSACFHHQYTKNGDLKNRVMDNQDGTVTCRMCGARFSIDVWESKKLKKAARPILEQIDLLKWCLAAGGSHCFDQNTMTYLYNLHQGLTMLPKINKRVTKVFQKTKQAKRKKNRNNYNVNKSGSNFGSWANR